MGVGLIFSRPSSSSSIAQAGGSLAIGTDGGVVLTSVTGHVVVAGAGVSFRNAANTADNVAWDDLGNLTVRGNLTTNAANGVSGYVTLTSNGLSGALGGSNLFMDLTGSVTLSALGGGISINPQGQTSINPGHSAFVGVETPGFTVSSAVTFRLNASIAAQRFTLFTAPTVTSVSANTVTTAATVAIAGAPTILSSAIITRPLALWVQSGPVGFDGNGDLSTGTGPAVQITGTWVQAGGTVTTTKPMVLIEPSGTLSASWSTAGTGLGVNAPAGFAGVLFDFQRAGATVLRLYTSGEVQSPSLILRAMSGTLALITTAVGAQITLAQAGGITLADAISITVGTATGTKIGTATNQLIGFYNAAPIAQRAGAAQTAVAVTGSTNATPFGYTTAAQADAIVTLVNELRAWAVAQGFIKGSA